MPRSAQQMRDEAQSAMLSPLDGPTLNGVRLFSGVARCPVCSEMTDIEFPCCNDEPKEDGE